MFVSLSFSKSYSKCCNIRIGCSLTCKKTCSESFFLLYLLYFIFIVHLGRKLFYLFYSRKGNWCYNLKILSRLHSVLLCFVCFSYENNMLHQVSYYIVLIRLFNTSKRPILFMTNWIVFSPFIQKIYI